MFDETIRIYCGKHMKKNASQDVEFQILQQPSHVPTTELPITNKKNPLPYTLYIKMSKAALL